MNWCAILFFCFLSLFIFEREIAGQSCPGTDIVCERCKQEDCPECYPISQQACCQQRSAVLALTAASIQASVYAFASAQAAVSASTKAIVGVTAVASAGAFVSISQSFSLTVNPDSSCNVSADVAAIANGYSAACSAAAAEAEAVANAVANASATAQSSSSAASRLYASAESLINSTCCGFDMNVLQLTIAAGQYVTNASIAAQLARNIAVSARNTSTTVKTAFASVNKTATSFINAKINNCCVNDLVSRTANESVADLDRACQAGAELLKIVSYSYDQVTAYGIHNNTLESAATVIASTSTSECADFPLGCCLNTDCCRTQGNVSTAVDSIVDVLLSSIAISQAYVDLAVETKAKARVLTVALANATAAVRAATYAAATIGISVTTCCSVTVSIDSLAVANASAVATSFAAAGAAARAVANASSYAYALAQAAVRGYASATAVVLAYGTGCCESSCCSSIPYPVLGDSFSPNDCCGIVGNIADSNSYKFAEISADSCSQVHKQIKSVSIVSNSTGATDCTNFIRRVTTSFKFFLNLCCCTTSAPTTVTATKIVTSTVTFATVVNRPNAINNIFKNFFG